MPIFIVGVIVVVIEAGRHCWKTLHGAPVPEESFGKPEAEEVEMALLPRRIVEPRILACKSSLLL